MVDREGRLMEFTDDFGERRIWSSGGLERISLLKPSSLAIATA
jgi:hypothetical protein